MLVRVDPVLPLPAGSRAELEGLAVPHGAAGDLASECRTPRRAANRPRRRVPGRGATREPADPRDRLEERLEFVAAMKELSRLPPRWQQVVIVNSQVWKQIDVAEILGVNPTRINYLLRRVSERLDEMAERRNELSGPSRHRAQRASASSRTIRRSGSPTRSAERRLGTRAQAQRSSPGDEQRSRSMTTAATMAGTHPTPPLVHNRSRAARRAHERAQRAVEQVREERVRRRGVHRAW